MRDSRALSLTHPSSSPSPYPPPPFYLYPPASHRRLSPLFSSFPIYLSSMSSTGHCFLTPNYINNSLLFALSHCLCLPVSCLIARPLSDSVCLCLRLCMSMSLSLVFTLALPLSLFLSLPLHSVLLALSPHSISRAQPFSGSLTLSLLTLSPYPFPFSHSCTSTNTNTQHTKQPWLRHLQHLLLQQLLDSCQII